MNAPEKRKLSIPSASEYILDNFKPTDRVAILVLNRQVGETTQRITTAQKASSPEFQAWLRYKNANGADIYIGMNALQHHASTRTKEDIEKISHVYLDLDHGGTASLEALEKSDLVPRPNYVLNTSPEKFQVVWNVEGMTIGDAEALTVHQIVRTARTRVESVAAGSPSNSLTIAWCACQDLPTKNTKRISMCRPAPNRCRLTTSAILSYRLKGPEASVLASKRYLHRGLAPALTQALAQVSDYGESLRDLSESQGHREGARFRSKIFSASCPDW
jgi:hypothetical protein